MSQLEFDLIESRAAFEAVRGDWDALYRLDPEAQYFLSWQWCSFVFSDYPHDFRVLVARAGRRTGPHVGLFPLRLKTVWSRSRRVFRNELHMAGTHLWAQYTGFLCHPDWEREVLVGFAAQLRKMHWSRLVLRFVRASQRRLDLFLSQFSDSELVIQQRERKTHGGEISSLICPYVELPSSYETYLKTCLSPNTRQKIRRFTRIVEHSTDLRITVSTADTIERDLDVLVALWVKQWHASKGERAGKLARKYRRILRHCHRSGELYMPVLWRGERPLGILGCPVDRQKRTLFFLVSGRDTSSPEPFIGWALHAHCIRWAITQRIEVYDLVHGNEPYKYSLGAKDREISSWVVKTRSGVNLNQLLDPSCVDSVVKETLLFLESGRFEEAKTACRQVRAVSKTWLPP